ncbi:AAEL001828-PA [Aedes aegypti]|uniref:AAEL001828-PA n=1 Tax=Aedes aegypti TaxID=7159 RepID=Q17K19_AEDAE|nr:AAEL001828-PA [Aedes aegypti]
MVTVSRWVNDNEQQQPSGQCRCYKDRVSFCVQHLWKFYRRCSIGCKNCRRVRDRRTYHYGRYFQGSTEERCLIEQPVETMRPFKKKISVLHLALIE